MHQQSRRQYLDQEEPPEAYHYYIIEEAQRLRKSRELRCSRNQPESLSRAVNTDKPAEAAHKEDGHDEEAWELLSASDFSESPTPSTPSPQRQSPKVEDHRDEELWNEFEATFDSMSLAEVIQSMSTPSPVDSSEDEFVTPPESSSPLESPIIVGGYELIPVKKTRTAQKCSRSSTTSLWKGNQPHIMKTIMRRSALRSQICSSRRSDFLRP